MESKLPIRPLTFRVENIPPGTTAEELTKYFYSEDQSCIRVRSIVPAVDSYELDVQEYTATITFQASNRIVLFPRLLDEDLSIDCDFHGFTPLYHPQEPIAADIIAVTGLAAHAFGSWAHSAQNMWLRDYLPRDASNARVLIYGYPSQLHGNTSRSILSDHSTNLIHRLLTMRESAKCQDRPIIFIGHSLGCLIIKKALCDINGSVGIYSSRLPVRSIIFFGAPHKGLETTALETLVKSQVTEDMIRELKSESPTLTELNDKFRYVAKNIDILTCYELSPTKTVVEMPDGTWKREGLPIMMVSLDSARQWYPREQLVACNADHSQIAKLKRGENSIYPSVRWAIKKALLSAGDLYSEAKGVGHDESHHLESVDEASKIRRSLLQNSHRQSSTPSDGVAVGAVAVLSRPLSEHAIDQQIQKVGHIKVNESTPGNEIQSNHDVLNDTESQWQSGIDVSKGNDTHSSLSPTDCATRDMDSIVIDESVATGKSTDPTMSLDVEATTLTELEEAGDLDSLNIESKSDLLPALQTEDLSIAKDDAKPLRSAIVTGDEEKLRELLQFHDIEQKDDKGHTPLTLVARCRNENIVRLLLEKGVNLGAIDLEGSTTLHLLSSPFRHAAVVLISETLIDLLLRDCPPLDVPDEIGFTPLMCACQAGEQLLATKLIHHGANVRAVTLKESTPFRGSTPLHFAALYGRAQIIPLLIANGAKLEARTFGTDFTPLHNAASGEADSSDTVEQLLHAGADKEARTWDRRTPLLIAIMCKKKACVASLLKSGADIEASAGAWRPLHFATRSGQLEIVKTLLDHGAKIEEKSPMDGQRPLHLAACYGYLEIIKALLDHGANPTARTSGLILGEKPSGMTTAGDVSSTQRNTLRALLKEAEKAWKRSGKK